MTILFTEIFYDFYGYNKKLLDIKKLKLRVTKAHHKSTRGMARSIPVIKASSTGASIRVTLINSNNLCAIFEGIEKQAPSQ